MTIELLSKPACVQCTASKKALDKAGIAYTLTDMVETPAALDLAKDLGHMQAPVLIVRDALGTIVDHFSGFQPEKIKALTA